VPVPPIGPEAGTEGSEAAGLSVCGSVARPGAAASGGMNSGPFWPQALRIATPAAARASRETSVLTRILETFNIVKL